MKKLLTPLRMMRFLVAAAMALSALAVGASSASAVALRDKSMTGNPLVPAGTTFDASAPSVSLAAGTFTNTCAATSSVQVKSNPGGTSNITGDVTSMALANCGPNTASVGSFPWSATVGNASLTVTKNASTNTVTVWPVTIANVHFTVGGFSFSGTLSGPGCYALNEGGKAVLNFMKCGGVSNLFLGAGTISGDFQQKSTTNKSLTST